MVSASLNSRFSAILVRKGVAEETEELKRFPIIAVTGFFLYAYGDFASVFQLLQLAVYDSGI